MDLLKSSTPIEVVITPTKNVIEFVYACLSSEHLNLRNDCPCSWMWLNLSTPVKIMITTIQECKWIFPPLSKKRSPMSNSVIKFWSPQKKIAPIQECDHIMITLVSNHPYLRMWWNLSTPIPKAMGPIQGMQPNFSHLSKRFCMSKSWSRNVPTKFESFFQQIEVKNLIMLEWWEVLF